MHSLDGAKTAGPQWMRGLAYTGVAGLEKSRLGGPRH